MCFEQCLSNGYETDHRSYWNTIEDFPFGNNAKAPEARGNFSMTRHTGGCVYDDLYTSTARKATSQSENVVYVNRNRTKVMTVTKAIKGTGLQHEFMHADPPAEGIVTNNTFYLTWSLRACCCKRCRKSDTFDGPSCIFKTERGMVRTQRVIQTFKVIDPV
jgi:hypothetical protein